MNFSPGFKGYVEFREDFVPRANIRHVLFDFDGTLSLIRQGWPEVMIPMFVEILADHRDESEVMLTELAREDIMRLNGKQTIYQMIQLAERIREAGGQPDEPLNYKREYLRRLHGQIEHRVRRLENGEGAASEWLVHGVEDLLQNLSARGLKLHLASGTDEPFVKREAELLGVAEFFEGRIYGALDNVEDFSKEMVIAGILSSHNVNGEQLLSFGDGYVEIANTKQVGGVAVAVASDEANNGSGEVDIWKRNRLWEVGADVVIADYRDADRLLDGLLIP